MTMAGSSHGGIAADPAELAAAAARARSAVAAVEAPLGVLRAGDVSGSAAVGAPRLAVAVEAFLRGWGDEVEATLADTRRVADALDLAAAAYRDVEVAAASPFARLLAWAWR
jgi:hypothetical protein